MPQLLRSCATTGEAHTPQLRTPCSQINKLNIFKKKKKWKEPRLKIIWQHCVEWIEVRRCWLSWERTINYCICLRKFIQIRTKVYRVSERGNKVYSIGQFTWYWWWGNERNLGWIWNFKLDYLLCNRNKSCFKLGKEENWIQFWPLIGVWSLSYRMLLHSWKFKVPSQERDVDF